MTAMKNIKIKRRRSQLKPKLAEISNVKTPCIPENGEVEFNSDLIEETIQMQYEENRNVMTQRLSEQHHGIDNIPTKEITKVLEIIFKFNCLAAVSGHSEEDVVARDFQAKSFQKNRVILA
jgi:hypothetical protein